MSSRFLCWCHHHSDVRGRKRDGLEDGCSIYFCPGLVRAKRSKRSYRSVAQHRLENILGKAPKEIHDELKAEILESFHAKSYEQGLLCTERFPSAMNGMEETLEACLQYVSEAHHKRDLELLERTFGELKRRTKVIPHFFTEQAAIKLSFAVLLATASKWRGVRMDVFTIRRIEELRNEFLPKSTSEETSSLTLPGEPYGDLTGH